MITFTKEQLIASAHARIEFAEMMLAGELEPLKERTWSIELELARIALASLEAEPVGFIARHKETGKFGSYLHPKADWFKNDDYEVLSAYTAPPAPVSVPEVVLKSLLPDVEKSEFWFEHDGKILFEGVKFNNAVFDACQAAMLQGADGNAPAHFRSRPAQSSLSPAQGGNSPVTPDCWVPCSERMPDNDESKPIAIFTGKCLGQGMFVATYDDDGFFDYWEGMEIIGVTHWMKLPEPPNDEN